MKYKIYEGDYAKIMPALRADRRVPMTIRQIAEKRIDAAVSEDEDMINGWCNNYFDTPDGIVYCNDEIKIVPDCDVLKNIKSYASRVDGGVLVSEEEYKNLKGKTFQNTEFEECLKQKKVSENPVWREFLGDVIQPYLRNISDCKMEIKGIKFDKSPEIPLVYSFNIGLVWPGSNLDVYDHRIDGIARLVGVRE